MTYSIKEIFYTLQGEGMNSGRPAVFCRFAGCNLWSGREEDRASAVCRFCDTHFVGTDGTEGGKYDTAAELAGRIESLWPSASFDKRFVVLTGGEPALQLDAPLLDELHRRGFSVAIETNGTQELPPGVDWVCVSPKAGTEVKIREGNELKLVYPQESLAPEEVGRWDFEHFLLQPMDGERRQENTRLAVAYCMGNPKWKLSIQTHKLIGIR